MKYSISEQWRIWQKVQWVKPTVAWAAGYLENGFCPQCQLCCGPQPGDEPFPMALLPSQIHPDIEQVFYMYDENHASLDARGCKALGPRGCLEPRENRPPACGLFPLVMSSGHLYLYAVCPASLMIPLGTWFNLGQEAQVWLKQFPLNILQHLDITLPDDITKDRYIDLHLQIWQA